MRPRQQRRFHADWTNLSKGFKVVIEGVTGVKCQRGTIKVDMLKMLRCRGYHAERFSCQSSMQMPFFYYQHPYNRPTYRRLGASGGHPWRSPGLSTYSQFANGENIFKIDPRIVLCRFGKIVRRGLVVEFLILPSFFFSSFRVDLRISSFATSSGEHTSTQGTKQPQRTDTAAAQHSKSQPSTQFFTIATPNPTAPSRSM